MKTVFVDTGGFYAALNRKDQHHQAATQIFHRVVEEEWRLLTSNFVVAETHALLLNRLGRDVAAAWLSDIPAALIRVLDKDEEKAKRIILSYRDKEFSYCDATSFAMMERLPPTRHCLRFSLYPVWKVPPGPSLRVLRNGNLAYRNSARPQRTW